MDDHERSLRENAASAAIADDCAAIGASIAAAEARLMRRLADAWMLANEQTERIESADSRRRDMPLRCMASQISVETHVHDRTVQRRMHDSWRLVTQFAATVAALEAGRISKGHAEVVLDTGGRLDDDVREAFETVVLEWATAETVGRTRAYARQLAEKLDPRTMLERHAEAADERSITVHDLDDGMSQIVALVPTVYAHAVLDRLTRQGHAIRDADRAARRAAREREDVAGGAGVDGERRDTSSDDGVAVAAGEVGGPFDDRTLDQIRADVFVDTLLTGAPAVDPTDDVGAGGLGAIRAQVQITMPLTTLTGVTQGGVEIDGKAPIDPEAGRFLSGAAPVWDRVMYDPVSAVVVAVDRYRPSSAQVRLLQARDRHCRFPGCRMPARRCQVDHNLEHHEDGATSVDNLACLCVRHRTMKTETEWTVRQLPGGHLEWRSPSRRSYPDHPPRVVFVSDPDPAPF
ncbi:HNH endonuclease signature motif containing protein [Microbacterium hominis]|uniref:DUF222 domain-containing protein n=1 Tax=Microbacterium hominis TaxID=162426 RepID=A0A7D4Q4F5_9MICO|nr:HNH endonuclease signature motif containing protein [Microbacterium hominis]QKJ20651.1 DUF222 domain-containing protein [Microbacterium hominis]